MTDTNISVMATNGAPLLGELQPILLADTADQDSFTASAGGLVASDPDGDLLTYGLEGAEAVEASFDGLSYDLAAAGAYGTLYLHSSTGQYRFQPRSDWRLNGLEASGTDSFQLSVSDGVNITTTSLVVNFSGSPEAPEQYVVIDEGGATLSQEGQSLWEAALSSASRDLENLLSNPSRDGLLNDVFGRAGTDAATFEANQQALLALIGGTGLQIELELRSNTELNGAAAAYAAVGHTGTERIYVNADLINSGQLNLELLTSALLEEYGHALDQRLNPGVDSPGDEGELFAAEVTGVTLTAQQRAVIEAEDDSAALTIGGVQVSVEEATVIGTTGNDNISTGTTGPDIFTGNGGNDRFDLNQSGGPTQTLAIGGSGTSGTVSNYDVITDYTPGANATTVADRIRPSTRLVASNTTSTTGAESSLLLNTNQTVKSHRISNGLISFDDATTFASGVNIQSAGDLAAVTQYLLGTDLGNAGSSVAFNTRINGINSTFVYIQGTNNAGGSSSGLVELQYVVATGIANSGANEIHVYGTTTPVIYLSTSSVEFTENGAFKTLDSGITVVDQSTTSLASASVAISGYLAGSGDALQVSSGTTGITTNFNSSTGILTLSGNATLANYQAALAKVQYRSTSDNPASSVTFLWTISDGTYSSTTTSTVFITAVNDAPVLNSASLTVQEGQTVTLSAANFSVTDPDNSAFAYTVSSISGGFFQLTSAPGAAITSFTTAQLNAGSVQFVDNGDETAPSFSVSVNDGSANSSTVAASITFSNVNDAPTLNANGISVSGDFVREVGYDISSPRSSVGFMQAGETNLADVDSSSFKQVEVRIRTSWVQNGVSEQLLISGGTLIGTSNAVTISLAPASGSYSGTVDFTLGGINYTATLGELNIDSNPYRRITLTRQGGAAMTGAQAEALLDALAYTNEATTVLTSVRRTFELTVTDAGDAVSNATDVVFTLGNGPRIDLDGNGNGYSGNSYNRLVTFTEGTTPGIKLADDGTAAGGINLQPLYASATYSLVAAPIAGLTFNGDGSWSYNTAQYGGPSLGSGESHTFTINYNWNAAAEAKSGQHFYTITVSQTGSGLVASSNRPLSGASGASIAGQLGPSVDRLGVGINTPLFVDSGKEFFVINGATDHIANGVAVASGDQGRLNLLSSPSSALGAMNGTYGSFSLGGVSYRYEFVQITGSLNRIFFTRNTGSGAGGTLTYQQAETLIDAYHYLNTSDAPTTGTNRTLNFGVFSEGLGNSPATATIQLVNVEDEARGSLTISGTSEEGATLSANTDAISDPDGSVTFTYQWQLSDNGTDGWTDLANATASSFSIAADQSLVGKFLRLQVTSTDPAGGTTAFFSDGQTIVNVNDAPVLTLLSTTTFTEDDPSNTVGSVVATFVTNDDEGDNVTVILSDTTNYSLGSGADAGKVLLTAAGLALVNDGIAPPAFTLTPNDGTIDGAAVTVNPADTPVNDAPTLTAFSGPVATSDDNTEQEISFADLTAVGDQADVDSSVTAFVVTAVSSGSLRIGTSAADATTWAAGSNDIINSNLKAYWTSEVNASGSVAAFTVVAQDEEGATSTTPVAVTLTVSDRTAPDQSVAITAVLDDVPQATGLINNGGLTNDTTPTVSGTLSAGLRSDEVLRIDANGQDLGTATVSGTSWSFTSPALTNDGRFTFTARVVDAAGNQGGLSSSRAINLITAGPGQIATIAAISDNTGSVTGEIAEGASTNDTTPTLSGTLSEALGAGETLHVYANGVSLAGTATVTAAGGIVTWSFTPSPPLSSNGSYSFTAAVVDGLGNIGTLSAVRTLLLDTVAPSQTVTITALSDDSEAVQGPISPGGASNDTTPTLSGSLSAALGDGETLKIYNGVTYLSDITVNTDLGWSYTPSELSSQGLTTFNVRVVDAAGNLGGQASRSFRLDTAAPTQTVTISDLKDNVTARRDGLPWGSASTVTIADGGVSNDNTPTLSGSLSAALAANGTSASAEALRIYANGVYLGNATTSGGTTSWTYTPTLSLDGTYTFTAQVVDGAGNEGALATLRTLVLDTQAPEITATITSLNDDSDPVTGPVADGGVTNDRTPTLSGTLSTALGDGDQICIYNGTVLLGTTTAASDLTWSFTPGTALATSAANPTYIFTARVVDATGNQGAASNNWTFTLDTTIPAKTVTFSNVIDNREPSTGVIANNGITNDTTPTLSGTVTALAAGEEVRVYANGVLLDTAEVTGTSWTYTPTLTSDGVYSFTARVVDGAGNEGTLSTARVLSLDTTTPLQSVVITSVTDNITPFSGTLNNGDSTNDTTPTLSGTLSAALATGEVLRIVSNGTTLGTAPVSFNSTNNTHSWSFTPAALAASSANPAYTFTAAVIDAAGNSSAASDPWTLVLDTTAPGQTITITDLRDDDASDSSAQTGSVSAGGFSNDLTPTLTGTLSAPLALGELLQISRVVGSVTTLLGNATVADDLTWAFTTTSLTAGSNYTFSARIVDAAGNLGTSTVSRSVTLDITAPAQTVNILSVIDDRDPVRSTTALTTNVITNDTTPTLSGTLSAGLSAAPASPEVVEVFINGAARGTATVSGTTWSFTAPSLSGDGTYTFSARVRDAAGYVGSWSAERSLVLDTTASDAVITLTDLRDDSGLFTGSIANGGSTNDTTPTLRGSLSAALAAGESLRVFNGTVMLGTASVASDLTWSFTPSTALPSTPGTAYTLRAQVVDAAGNLSSSAPSWVFNLDSTAPTPTVSITDLRDDVAPVSGSVTNAGATNDATPILSGTLSTAIAASDTLRIYAARAGSTFYLGDAQVTGTTWTFQAPPLTVDGAYTFTARVADAVGNEGTASAARSLVLDTTAPSQAVSIASLGAGAALAASGSASPGVASIPAGVDVITNTTTPTLSGNLNATLGGGEVLQVFSNGLYLGNATVSGTSWTYKATLTQEGIYTFTACVVDAAGNSGPSPDRRVLLLDTSVAVGQTVTITDLRDDSGTITGSIGAGGVSNDTTPTLSGTLAVGLAADERLRVFNGTTLLGEASVSSDLSWSFTPTTTLTKNGAFTFSARVVDTAGNQGPASAARVFTLDTVAPTATAPIANVNDDVGTATGSISAAGFSDDTTPTLSGNLSAAVAASDVVRVYANGAWLGNATLTGITAGSSWSFTPSTALTPNTTTSFTTRVMDAAGNEGPASPVRLVNILDSTNPVHTATITDVLDNVGLLTGSVSAGGATDDTTPTLIGSLSSPLGLGDSLQILRNGTVITGALTWSNATSWSFTPGAAVTANGAYTYTARVINTLGMQGNLSTGRSLVLDTIAPTSPTVTITNVIDDVAGGSGSTGSITAGGVSDDTTPTLSGALSAGLTNGDSLKVFANGVLLGDASVNGLTWSFTPATALSVNRAHTFTVTVVDAAGNRGTGSATSSRIYNLLDSVAPTQAVTITGVSDNAGLITMAVDDGGATDDTTPTLSGTLSAALGLGELVQIARNGTVLGNASVTGTGWSYTPAAFTANGAYTFTARVVDGAGYASSSAASRSLVLDTVAPTTVAPQISTIVDDAGASTGTVSWTVSFTTDDTTPTLSGSFSGTLAAGDTVRVLRNGVVAGIADLSGSSWTYTPTLTIGGAYTFTAAVFDAAGNRSSNVSTARALTLIPTQTVAISSLRDNVGSVTGAISEGQSTNDPTPTLSGTLSAGLRTGETLRVYDNGSLLSGNATVTTSGSSFTWSFTPLLTSNGVHSFTAVVLDSSSNAGQVSAARSFSLSLDPAIAATANSDSLTGTLDAEDRFLWSARSSGLLGGSSGARSVDTITNFESRDALQIAGSAYNASLTSSVGNATSLDSLGTLLTSTRLPANSARAFSVTGYTGTFVAFNDGTAGFTASTDALVFLQNYTLSASNPVSVI